MMRCFALCLMMVHLVWGFYEGTTVTVLTPETMSSVTSSEDIWLVQFYAPWSDQSKAVVAEWVKAADFLKGVVRVGVVDVDKYPALGNKYAVNTYPKIKVFAEDKAKPTDYEGHLQAIDILNFAFETTRVVEQQRREEEKKKEEESKKQKSFYADSEVVEITSDNFDSLVRGSGDPWLIEFYAPWCGHCKDLAPTWRVAAKDLAGVVRVGAIDATVHTTLGDKYGVEGYPTIKFFAPGAEAVEDYRGSRGLNSIVKFATKKAASYPPKPLHVGQLATRSDLDTCLAKKALCVVFIVPHVMDTQASGRREMIEMFSKVHTQLRKRSVDFGWIAGGDHIDFEESLRIFSTYPTFVAISRKKKRFETYRGPFTAEGISSFIVSILDGTTGMHALTAPVTWSTEVPAWDGQDYAPPQEDE